MKKFLILILFIFISSFNILNASSQTYLIMPGTTPANRTFGIFTNDNSYNTSATTLDYTIELRNWSNSPAGSRNVVGQGFDGSVRSWFFSLWDDYTYEIAFALNGVNAFTFLTGNIPVSDTDWVKIRVVASSSTNTIQIYFNDVLTNTLNTTINSITNNNENLKLFGFQNAIADGLSSEIRYFSISNQNGLMSEYTFTEGSGTTLSDNGPKNNTATIVGGTWIDPVPYPLQINLDSNYNPFADIIYTSNFLTTTSSIVNDVITSESDVVVSTNQSNISPFTFIHWLDLDDNSIYSTSRTFTITNVDRDYNLRAIYDLTNSIDLSLNSNLPNPPNFNLEVDTIEQQRQIISQYPFTDKEIPFEYNFSVKAPTNPITIFNVTNDASGAYIINGESNPTLELIRGNTYTFNINAIGHNFWIQTQAGAYNSTYTFNDGVTNNGTENGTITFTVPLNAPNTLFYKCQYHLSMGGTINIVDSTPQNDIGFYNFVYWFDNINNEVFSFDPFVSLDAIENFNLTATYTLPDEYQIVLTLFSNIGDITFQLGNQPIITGSFIEVTISEGDSWTASGPLSNDFEFISWIDLENNNVFSTNRSFGISNTTRNYILEATYFPIFDINWDSAGGTLIAPQRIVSGGTLNAPEDPIRPNFVFDGWINALTLEQESFPQIVTENVTYQAVWLNTFVLVFNSNGGSQVESQIIVLNGTATSITPSRIGFLFDGWYTDNVTFTNEFDFSTPFTANLTLHAKWVLGSTRDVNTSLINFLEDAKLNDRFSQIILVLAVFVFLNVLIFVYSSPMIVTIILNFMVTAVFIIIGFIPIWIIIVIFLGTVGYILLTLTGGRS